MSHDTYESRADLIAAQQDPRYAQSPRYREEVAAKLERSMTAGTITQMAQHIRHEDMIGTRHVRLEAEPEGIYGGAVKLPGADPIWAEAGKVGGGFFDGPEAIARAKAAPHYEVDSGYQQAVQEKIARSIREKFIDTNLQALDPAGRFTR
jgi:hypothetical protein